MGVSFSTHFLKSAFYLTPMKGCLLNYLFLFVTLCFTINLSLIFFSLFPLSLESWPIVDLGIMPIWANRRGTTKMLWSYKHTCEIEQKHHEPKPRKIVCHWRVCCRILVKMAHLQVGLLDPNFKSLHQINSKSECSMPKSSVSCIGALRRAQHEVKSWVFKESQHGVRSWVFKNLHNCVFKKFNTLELGIHF